MVTLADNYKGNQVKSIQTISSTRTYSVSSPLSFRSGEVSKLMGIASIEQLS